MIADSYFPTTATLAAVGEAQESLHHQAAATAHKRFGSEVFVRGVVEVSNFCRENCQYCGMRRDNRTLNRYRANWEALAELVIHHRPGSVTDLNIQAGEDPVVVRDVVIPLLEALRRETSLGLSVCLGTLNSSLYNELQSAGAEIYILKFETATPDLYARLQAPGTFPERLDHIRRLAADGWKVSSGFIAGLPGETPDSLLSNFRLASELPLDGCSVSPFIPGIDTPSASEAAASIDPVLNCMAALRLLRPDWVIPAVSALNICEPGSGYRRGLRTGANLSTINLTPEGQRENYILYTRDRFLMTEERILTAIQAENRVPSTTGLAHFFRSKKASAEKGYTPVAEPCEPQWV